jgi:hypothetical protein
MTTGYRPTTIFLADNSMLLATFRNERTSPSSDFLAISFNFSSGLLGIALILECWLTEASRLWSEQLRWMYCF